MVLALFDFDGTITRKDSLSAIIRFIKGDISYIKGLLRLAPTLLMYKAGRLSNTTAKERVLQHFFGGMDVNAFQQACDSFGIVRLESIVRNEAMQKIREHQQQNHRIILVSASCENWLSAWCEKVGIEYLATRLEVINDIVTGKLSGENCYGPEKVRRINEITDIATYTRIYAYGDSKGDMELLSIATDPNYRVFKN